MRILHFANSLYPVVTGGTEIFVHQLLQAQKKLDHSTQVISAAHESDVCNKQDKLDIELKDYQILLPPIVRGNRMQSVTANAAEIPGFIDLLTEFRPDVVHMHSFSPMCGLSHAHAVKAVGAKLIVSVHAPGFSCIKGSLINASGSICDGILRERRCTLCRLHNSGLPRWLSGLVALQTGWPFSSESPGKLAHVLTAKQLTAAAHQSWRDLTDYVDSFHVYPTWNRDVLLRQGIPSDKVHLVHTAGPQPLQPRQRVLMQDGLLRLVYWGRCHPVKGIHLLIKAIQALPLDTPILLDFYGPYWNSDYGMALLRSINGDKRFRLQGNLSKDELLPRLQTYDLAVVPSIWMETGPLTVLEAFAAGLPVAGSDLGGIKELLSGVQGCELLPMDWRSWRNYLQKIFDQPSSLAAFAPPSARTFHDVAREMAKVYSL